MQSFPEYFWCLRFILFYVEEVLVQQLGCTQKYIKKERNTTHALHQCFCTAVCGLYEFGNGMPSIGICGKRGNGMPSTGSRGNGFVLLCILG